MAIPSSNAGAFEVLESRLLFASIAAGSLALTACDPATTPAATTNPTTVPAISTTAKAGAAIQYSAPLVITKGGTYTGNWESNDPNVPAVEIKTAEPVIIENSNIRSKSDLIRCRWGQSNLTVRNTNGYGLNPNVADASPGRFLDMQFFAKAVVENCYLESTGGIYFNEYGGGGTSGNTITVRYNIAKNIDGRKSDGNGGWLTSTGPFKQFLQLNNCHGLPGAEIAWNQITNEAGKSRVEDNISIHLSDGTAAEPILIHDNFIHGAYNQDPAHSSYSGGGIMLDDGSTGDLTKVGGYVKAFNNVVISTSNYGIAISSGHDCEIYNNRILMSGKLSDGTTLFPGDAGIYIRNALDYPTFKNNTAHDNVVGWARANGSRNDFSLQDAIPAASQTGNQSMTGPITNAMEDAELIAWLARVAVAKIKLGPPAPTSSVPELNSDPGASNTLYLDFDGDLATGTPAFTGSDSDITEIWNRVSEKYSPFDLNVTTVDPGALIAHQSARILIGGGTGVGANGGLAGIGDFNSNGATGFTYAINLANNPAYIGESAAHEAGHLFGLSHQNDSAGGEYNSGDHFDAPIMGSSYFSLRGKWWTGPSGSNTQNDLDILDGALGRADGYGIIERSNDVDAYRFITTGGEIDLTLAVPDGSMLNTKGMLLDPGLAPMGTRDRRGLGEAARIFLPAGSYTILVLGHGDYGDIGQYTLSGQDASGDIAFTEVATPSTPPAAAPPVQVATVLRLADGTDDKEVLSIDASDILNAAA